MPVIRDSEGNVYAISFEQLQPYKVSNDNLPKVHSARDEDDIELQSAQSTGSYQWYAGD